MKIAGLYAHIIKIVTVTEKPLSDASRSSNTSIANISFMMSGLKPRAMLRF